MSASIPKAKFTGRARFPSPEISAGDEPGELVNPWLTPVTSSVHGAMSGRLIHVAGWRRGSVSTSAYCYMCESSSNCAAIISLGDSRGHLLYRQVCSRSRSETYLLVPLARSTRETGLKSLPRILSQRPRFPHRPRKSKPWDYPGVR